MKEVLVSVFFSLYLPLLPQDEPINPIDTTHPVGNVFIITTDGFRWQEVFNGADPALLNSNDTANRDFLELLYGGNSTEERRKKLLPFFWNIIATKGQLYGNRQYDNNVNVSNVYAISYPGYNEMLTGNDDFSISGNRKIDNPHINVLEYLNNKKDYQGRVAAFTSWDVFPYILNRKRSGLYINSGYDSIVSPNNALSIPQQLINRVQDESIHDKQPTRHDMLTFLVAREHVRQHRPRVLYLGLGETDEFAHQGRYDLYLQQANQVDRMIAELWHWVQTTPGYKDNTTFIITTDHGRGRKRHNWDAHGSFIRGSSETWLAVIGPGIPARGEVTAKQQLYQRQLAGIIAGLLGESFGEGSD